jgi:hypothetical protein
MANFGYLVSGAGQRFSSQSIYGVGSTLKLGRATEPKGSSAFGQEVMGVDVALGNAVDVPNKFIGFVSDRRIGAASGWTVNHMPTYGQGVTAINTTFGTDRSQGSLQKFAYFGGNGVTSKLFSSLS